MMPKASSIWLGTDATEERAKALRGPLSVVHFACHGIIDERYPLDSALALSVPASTETGLENGLLQAWEIFEQVRFDSGLVVMSACDTALGKEMGGEGIVGLTRAFQYAGARSVLASLWSVADASTASLMKSFYGHMKAGKTKDEALRLAQMDLILGGIAAKAAPTEDKQPRLLHPSSIIPHLEDWSHPYYWAAFQLYGDWR